MYNALNHSNHTNVDDIEFTTIENVIYITMKNDVSFLIGNELNLYEEQSTYNPNMQLRGLMYFAPSYQLYLTNIGKDLYVSRLVKVPTPRFVVFCNGNKEIPDISTQKLSDAFLQEDKSLSFAIKNNFFNGYFRKLKMEVLNMSLTEFNEEEFIRNRHLEEKIEIAKNLLALNILSINQIASSTGLSLQEVNEINNSSTLI